MNRQVPYVAAIHDLSGVGRCALTIVLPVLSAMGCQCAPLPTAYGPFCLSGPDRRDGRLRRPLGGA